jgi:hypothetical protein
MGGRPQRPINAETAQVGTGPKMGGNATCQAQWNLRSLIQVGTPMANENSVVEIHVRLLDEGTDCSRPTRGVYLGNGLFRLLPTDHYDSNNENWEFIPGSIVRAKEVRNADGTYLLAVAREGS